MPKLIGEGIPKKEFGAIQRDTSIDITMISDAPKTSVSDDGQLFLQAGELGRQLKVALLGVCQASNTK